MLMAFQDRVILLLEDGEEFEEIKDIFRSPLGLVQDMVEACFTEGPNSGLLKYEQELDAIKKRVAGVTRSRELSSTYKVAGYASYLFAFQQFFHSSYRARQGGALESIVYYSLGAAGASPLNGTGEKKRRVKALFGIPRNVGYDVDFLATKQNRLVLGQIRSTDVTGGTTAKGSLVDLLRFILREKTQEPETRYLIVVWEALESQQKSALINKIWDSLRSEVGEPNERSFKENIDDGWAIPDSSISIRLIYGVDELGEELSRFADDRTAKTKITALWESIQKWDDLWLTYAIASLELENLVFRNLSNFQILKRKMRELGLAISGADLQNYRESSAAMAEKIARSWTENTLPVSSPAEALNYIRDLVLLRMIDRKERGT